MSEIQPKTNKLQVHGQLIILNHLNLFAIDWLDY